MTHGIGLLLHQPDSAIVSTICIMQKLMFKVILCENFYIHWQSNLVIKFVP